MKTLCITIEADERSFDETAALRIVEQLKNKPDSVVGLPTGRTTCNMHRRVAQLWSGQPFDVSRATFFGVDEVVGVSRYYSGACYTMLKTQIIDGLSIDDDHFLMLPTESDDFAVACERFTAELRRRGGIDLLILGLGENGHLGFNQPGTPFESRAWVTDMDTELERRIRRETQTPADKWLGGVTLGLADIFEAKHIILVAKGANKTDAVSQMLQGPVTPQLPASLLQRHPHCEVLLDQAAARNLKNLPK